MTAQIARGLGLDATSVHEIGRRGLADVEQLRHATSHGQILVTRNRDDFLQLTMDFYERSESHGGVLIVTRGLPNDRPAGIAHALKHWADAHAEDTAEASAYRVEYL